MAEATEFTIGARAHCSDGFCGEVSRVIIDPATRAVTHLVIEPKHRPRAGRLVPLDLVGSTAGGITLRCSIAEFNQLDPAEDVELVDDYVDPSGYGGAEAVQGYGGTGSLGVGASVSGLGIGMGDPRGPRMVVSDAVPLGETEVGRGEPVHALDGEIGRVQGFLVDSADRRVTHVLLQEGHLWGRKQVAIPVSAVTEVGAGIRLSITKQQVEDLPPAG